MSFLTSRESHTSHGVGKSIPRREDARLLTGAGQYAIDFSLPGQLHAYLVRSPHAHAKIVKINVAQAIGGPGVIAVLTGGDAAAEGLKPIPHSPVPTNPHEVPLRNRDGFGFFIAPHPVLACDAVRYVGEPVAIVIAETLAAAMDAAEQVGVVCETVAAVARSQDALSSGAPLLWDKHGSNMCVDSETGDKEATEAAFPRAAHRSPNGEWSSTLPSPRRSAQLIRATRCLTGAALLYCRERHWSQSCRLAGTDRCNLSRRSHGRRHGRAKHRSRLLSPQASTGGKSG